MAAPQPVELPAGLKVASSKRELCLGPALRHTEAGSTGRELPRTRRQALETFNASRKSQSGPDELVDRQAKGGMSIPIALASPEAWYKGL
ncbi:hypothetical protein WJX84_006838 [Apatococcus fuscideae]|uniref:Uncharacterized protein n=1 Tax=Apatococcus fuscideae TaxID=2026836 RepID=A0AAW1RN75_9CHLO